jgi:hypothetical protein
MDPRRLRLWLAVILFVAAVGIIVLSLLPGVRVQQVLPVPPVQVPTPSAMFFLLGMA